MYPMKEERELRIRYIDEELRIFNQEKKSKENLNILVLLERKTQALELEKEILEKIGVLELLVEGNKE